MANYGPAWNKRDLTGQTFRTAQKSARPCCCVYREHEAMSERERFEAWYSRKVWTAGTSDADRAFEVWQAARATPPEADALCAEMRAALELIAAPMRPDGTWNRDREACRELAARVLELPT